ncbi:MAG TPA: carboxypeptidase-like regulatory domain-containing protein [Allosphingosinicella sp.]
MRLLRRAGLAFAAACAATAAAASAPEPGWTATEDDSLLFEARLGRYRLGSDIPGYQTPEGVCVNLAAVIKALDIPVEVDAGKGLAEGWAFEERNRLKIDRRSAAVLFKGGNRKLAPSEVRDTPEGWCVTAASLSEWLGIGLVPDLRNAVILVQSTAKLPVELAAERRARAGRVRPMQEIDYSALPQVRLPYALWRMPSLDAVVTLGGLSDKQRGKRLDRQYELYGSGEVAAMSVDARLSSTERGAADDFRIRAYRSDSEGRLLGPLRATHFGAGDVSSFGSALVSRSMPGRGAVVTNRPIDRPDTFDRKTFRGELPSGWDAEIYRNGQLLGAAQNRSDGRYEFVDMPLLFGPNRFEIILYGPQGQLRREEETVMVGPDSISPRETWYWAGASQDERDLFSLGSDPEALGRGWRGALGVERGIDTRTSLSAQVHSLVLDDERLTYMEGAVRRSVGPALVEVAGSYQTKGGYALRGQLLGQLGKTYVSAESIVGRRFVSDRVDRGVTGSHRLGLEHSFDLGKLVMPVHVEGRYVRRESGNDSLEAGARLSASFNGLSFTGGIDWRRHRRGTGPDPPDIVETAFLANGSIGRTRLRGEMRWRLSPRSKFESAALVGQRQIGERSDLRAEIGYDRGLDRMRGAIGYVHRFSTFSVSVNGEAASDGSLAAGLNLALSLGPDPLRGGFRLASGKLASTGTTLARVFRDENGDGVRQPQEPLAPDVQLKIGRAPVEKLTGKAGEVLIDNLEPHRPVLVGVDSSSLPDPLVQAAGAGVVVVPRPGQAVAVDLPLVSAGEVLGTLVDSSGASIEGIDLELVDRAGRVAAATRSDFDGFFLFESVAYGSYGLRIARLSAQAAKLAPELSVRAEISGKTPSVKLGRVEAQGADAPRLAYAELVLAGLGDDRVR